jgi:superfamily II DNA/RNA helicase
MVKQFEELGICEHVLKVVKAKKFEKPSEIQIKTIPLVLEGKDVIAGSKTGSGKTLVFGAGIIKNVEHERKIQALVLTPTRELAEQVSSAIGEFAYYKKLEVVSVYGGVSIENQIKKLAYADIVVATPGRLLDHMNRKSINLSNVRFLVLDEADRMWDMGFKEDVSKIVNGCPKEKQTLLFSATISQELESFSKRYMKAPVEISVESFVDASKLKQVYYDVRDDGKFSLLVHLLKKETSQLSMIFCNTRRNADFVATNLKNNGINAQVIHGGMEQNKRTRVLKGFDDSKINILVCTDVAARGLDIPNVSHVYNYDIASDPKDYIHRIGRTARAGKEGIAVNILASRDYDNFANVQKHNQGIVIEREMTPRYEKIFVKWDAPKGGRFSGRGNGRDSRGPRSGGGNSRGPRGDSGSRGSFGKPRSGGDNRRSGGGSFRGPRSGGNSSGGRSFGGPRRDSGDSRGPRRFSGGGSSGPRKFSGPKSSDSRGPRSGGDSRGRDQRGERNKRFSSGGPRRSDSRGSGPRRDSKSGFRGSGRDTRRTRK